MRTETLLKEFNEMTALPYMEIEMKNGEFLLVELTANEKGINVSFDKEFKAYFSSNVTEHGIGFFMPFDDCFTLDEHLQEIYGEIIEGYLIPNNLY